MPAHIDPRDLEQDALLGLCASEQAWSFEEDTSFEAYATVRMRGTLLDGLRKSDPVGRLIRSRLRRLAACQTRLEHALGRRPRSAELAAELGWSLDEIFACTQYAAGVGGQELLDDLRDESLAADPVQTLTSRQEQASLAQALETLALHERAILALHFEHGWMYWQIGKWLGVSESRAQQLAQEALDRLRHLLQDPAALPATPSPGRAARKKEPGHAGFEDARKIKTPAPPDAWPLRANVPPK